MSPIGTPEQPLRAAIVGSGPAGFYAAEHLLKRDDVAVEVDMFDRLPTPFGLVRAGVAPDHPKIKSVIRVYEKTAAREGFRFFGNVEVGRDVTVAELSERYHAVVYAYGTATDFVGWYNGHPDRRELAPDLSGERAVVIGNGNVAADVARMLTLDAGELERTDVADHALKALRQSSIAEVVVLGRRGPAQAAFTSAELRELGHLDGVDLRIDPADVELDPVSEEWLASEGTFTARKNLELLREFAERAPQAAATRRIELRFLRSPVEVLGSGRVEGVKVRPNRIERDDEGSLRARPLDEEPETIECGLVLRSVGYQAVPLPDVPFDERRYVLPNQLGRVFDPSSGETVPGVYAVGWIKRGPTGILGTNKRDAQETVACLEKDLEAGVLARPANPRREQIDDLLAETVPQMVTAEGWRSIDELERERGLREERPRVKLASREELLSAGGTR